MNTLFQTSVIKKYVAELDSVLLDKKYKEFTEYFHNSVLQNNIRNSKEEQFQEGFFRELFVNIFGYTLNPNPDYNLITEQKNVDDSKKSDGAILKDEQVVAVIELKSTATVDLDKIEIQAFGYKNHNPNCNYVITSNFEKIRIYVENAVAKIEFNLFTLTREDFNLMWLCFAMVHLINNVKKVNDRNFYRTIFK